MTILINQNRPNDCTTANKKFAERVKGLLLVGVSVSVLSGLTACGGGGGGGGGGGVGTTCTDTAGEPDIMGQITYTPSTVAVGGSVTMHIPIDGITAYVGAELSGISGGMVVGSSSETLAAGTAYVTVGSLGPQTIDIPLTIDPASAAGSYIPTINLCTVDLNTCKKVPASGGVAVNYASNPVALGSAPLQRYKYFAGGAEITPSLSNLPVDSCVGTPVLAVGP